MNTYKITEITLSEAVNHSAGEYNRAEWVRKVNLYTKFNPTFYANESAVFVKYHAEGINFFSEVTIHSILSTTGFARVDFDAYMEDGMLQSENIGYFLDNNKFKIEPSKTTTTYQVSFCEFSNGETMTRIPNTKNGRAIMVEKSKFGVVFSQM